MPEVIDKPEPVRRCRYCRQLVDRKAYVVELGLYGGYLCDNPDCEQLADDEIRETDECELERDREEFFAKHGQWP